MIPEYEEQAPYPASQPAIVGHTTEGALQYQLEGIEIVEKVEHTINGEVERINPNGTISWEKRFKPMVNKNGLNMIRGYLQMYLGGTKTFALSDLDEEYIYQETRDVGHNIIAELMDNWNDYEVKDYAAASFITNIVCSAVHAVMKKGQDATYLKFLRTTQNIQEVQHHNPAMQNMGMQREKQNIMGMLFGKKNR